MNGQIIKAHREEVKRVEKANEVVSKYLRINDWNEQREEYLTQSKISALQNQQDLAQTFKMVKEIEEKEFAAKDKLPANVSFIS